MGAGLGDRDGTMKLTPMRFTTIEGTDVTVQVASPADAKRAIKELRHRKKASVPPRPDGAPNRFPAVVQVEPQPAALHFVLDDRAQPRRDTVARRLNANASRGCVDQFLARRGKLASQNELQCLRKLGIRDQLHACRRIAIAPPHDHRRMRQVQELICEKQACCSFLAFEVHGGTLTVKVAGGGCQSPYPISTPMVLVGWCGSRCRTAS